jgi:hypothetical protein
MSIIETKNFAEQVQKDDSSEQVRETDQKDDTESSGYINGKPENTVRQSGSTFNS